WWLAGRSLRPAEQAWSRQQLFVANASHELRAPLTLMRASTEVALRTLPAADTDNRALMDDVLQETDHMTRLVEDLLLLSRLDARRLKLDSKPVPVQEMLSTVQRQVSRVADERGVRLLIGGSEGSEGGATGREPVVLGDATRLRQVLLVLLDNALRHTPAGGSITLTSSRHGRYVQICIADTGSGIAAEHIPHLFERFYQADSSRGGTNSEGEGSGLGLAIAKGLVEAQHGHISISSQLGQGTQVTISLPSATK
ncbi:MAG: ATP-binding protein, partial [Chloroflexota bacterium]